MAKISPFLTGPAEWVEKLAALKEDRKKIEDAEERLKEKLALHLKEKGVDFVVGDKHEVRIERRESTDFSQKALGEVFGGDWLREAKAKLPVRVSEFMKLGEKKDHTKESEIVEFFSKDRKEQA